MVYSIKMMVIKRQLYYLHLGLKEILTLTLKTYYQEND